ncbi:hypothetical protein GV67_05000 [Pseudorhizobium pelagicum]|uniref:Uncharacterized protein n=1 Tax=Pseudorhizobium pelagicum TaxID=1509405 RepID=A0A922P020_9HYPH|nr:hypothetical protein GV67_05000 [Pseudorhizobium pelagicum]KEQ06151.1 hypothetical protein GV68_07750 [Pseudorhizobium pelagicum]
MQPRKVEALDLADQIEQELGNNQRDAAEAFVRSLLQRRFHGQRHPRKKMRAREDFSAPATHSIRSGV